jgi:hypothetical protein
VTIIHDEKIRCGACGAENTYSVVGSIDTFTGSADLDMRPPETARSTIFTWVQRCPECGYCAGDVNRFIPGSQEIMKGTEYNEQIKDQLYPDLVNSFLCKAIIDREARDYTAATWALIYAAWACDDSALPDQAVKCRQKAADMAVIAEEHGQQLTEQEGASTTILIDLLRRSGQLEQARQVIETRQGNISIDIISQILEFQKYLLGRNDTSCHTMSEAIKKKRDMRTGQCQKCGRMFDTI